MILAALGVALTLDAALLLLPENDYQRWQLVDGTLYGQLRWMYERIHFDSRPIDVAILGSSRSQLGLSAAAIEHELAQHGGRANVVNFSHHGRRAQPPMGDCRRAFQGEITQGDRSYGR